MKPEPDHSIMSAYSSSETIFLPRSDEISWKSPYSRCAWIIPVRGTIPWHHATSGILLDTSSVPSAPSHADVVANSPITWTRASVAAFWAFLLELRQHGTYGSIGLSFNAAPARIMHPERSSSGTSSLPVSSSRVPVDSHSDIGLRERERPRTQLHLMDHIKIYHAGSSSMYLRNALDLWEFVSSETENSAGKAIRVLSQARLILVDERSRGIVIS